SVLNLPTSTLHTMCLSDWSSVVCSSDPTWLNVAPLASAPHRSGSALFGSSTSRKSCRLGDGVPPVPPQLNDATGISLLVPAAVEIGRASCRESVEIWGVRVALAARVVGS